MNSIQPLVIKSGSLASPLEYWISLVLTYITLHYLLWFLVPILLFYATWKLFGVLGLVLNLIVCVVYSPSFLDGCQLKLGRPWPELRRHSFWNYIQRYMRTTWVREEELDPEKRYIFSIHPHGILILSRLTAYGGMWEALFPKINFRVLGASPMFFIPCAREICLWMGAVDARKKTADYVLSNEKFKCSIVVYPGGSKEIFQTNPQNSTDSLVLQERKGFVRLALQHGCEIVPCFVFGEKHCYSIYNAPQWVRSFFLKVLRVPLLIFWGKFLTWIPRQPPNGITIVYGKPMKVPNVDKDVNKKDFDQLVDQTHAQYMKELRSLFDRHKHEYGMPEDDIAFI